MAPGNGDRNVTTTGMLAVMPPEARDALTDGEFRALLVEDLKLVAEQYNEYRAEMTRQASATEKYATNLTELKATLRTEVKTELKALLASTEERLLKHIALAEKRNATLIQELRLQFATAENRHTEERLRHETEDHKRRVLEAENDELRKVMDNTRSVLDETKAVVTKLTDEIKVIDARTTGTFTTVPRPTGPRGTLPSYDDTTFEDTGKRLAIRFAEQQMLDMQLKQKADLDRAERKAQLDQEERRMNIETTRARRLTIYRVAATALGAGGIVFLLVMVFVQRGCSPDTAPPRPTPAPVDSTVPSALP